MVRIFTACHGTQLLVIQHLRRHLQLPPAREFLVWYPIENISFIDNFMQSVIATAGFDDTLDIRNFESLQPRIHGPLKWWGESVRRLRHDVATVHNWLKKNHIHEHEVELWADEPIHFNVNFLRGLLRQSRHVKIPHCFNHEDVTSLELKVSLEKPWREASWPKRFIFLPWQRWTSGVDMRTDHVIYDRAYTFDMPSSWCKDSIDVLGFISVQAFQQTYETLPVSLRGEVEENLTPIRRGPKPLVLLLLFGIDARGRQLYQTSVARLFRERSGQLKDCSLAVKVHPGSSGEEEEIFFDWLQHNVPAKIFPIRSALNLEFMLPQLRPDFVWAGPCGALPIVNRLQVGRPIGLAEIFADDLQWHPESRLLVSDLLRYIEIW
jgi:hypothetical protein